MRPLRPKIGQTRVSSLSVGEAKANFGCCYLARGIHDILTVCVTPVQQRSCNCTTLPILSSTKTKSISRSTGWWEAHFLTWQETLTPSRVCNWLRGRICGGRDKHPLNPTCCWQWHFQLAKIMKLGRHTVHITHNHSRYLYITNHYCTHSPSLDPSLTVLFGRTQW